MSCKQNVVSPPVVPHQVSWQPPQSGLLKLNIDVAVNGPLFGFGAVCRNSVGELKFVAGTCVLRSGYTILAEAMNCLWGLRVAFRRGYRHILECELLGLFRSLEGLCGFSHC